MNKQKKPNLIDLENPIWNKETFKKSRPAKDVLPQIFNAQRFETNLDDLPRTMRAFEACMKLEAFQKAKPSACPDAE